MSQSDNRKARRAAQRRVDRAAEEIGAAPESVEEAKRIVNEAYDRRAEPQGTPDLEIGTGPEAVISIGPEEDLQEPDEPEVTPEDAAAATEALPPLVTAADLAPEEEDEIPPEPQAASVLPGERHGPFIVQRTPGYGDGYRDLIVNGDLVEPVGVWAHREHYDLDGPALAEMLITMGLPQPRAVAFGRQRQGRIDSAPAAMEHPAVAKLVVEEERHRTLKDEFSKAFVQAQSKKEKGAKK